MRFEEALAAARKGAVIRRTRWPFKNLRLRDDTLVDQAGLGCAIGGGEVLRDDWEISVPAKEG